VPSRPFGPINYEPQTGKKYTACVPAGRDRPYSVEEAVPLVKKVKFAKFDETVELHLRLGVDGKHADQMVRGTIVLPTVSENRRRFWLSLPAINSARPRKPGADYVGGDEMVLKIQNDNWTDYDAVIATPDMMRGVGRLGKVLGPRGLMPNPKTGTVTNDIAQAVKEVKAGKVEFRLDKPTASTCPVGKVSFEAPALVQNTLKLLEAVVKAKPSAAKGSTFVARPSVPPWDLAFTWM